MRHSSRTLPGPEGALALSEAGEGGVPALLVHGGGADRGHWEPLQQLLPTRSLALDLRGMGESAPPADGRYGVEPAAEDVARVAEALLPQPFCLVGHSFGAAVALAYAARHPARLAGLVLVDPASDPRHLSAPQRQALHEGLSPGRFRAFTETWFEGLLVHARATTRARVLGSLRATAPAVFAACLESSLHFDPCAALARYGGPRLALVSEALAGPDSLHLQAASRLPHVTLAQVSHWPMLDAPGQVAAQLGRFLQPLG
ncbi:MULTISPECIES: alpha/beta fold hydrolase [Myxococcaceae]|uniref:alpha/beta fold hydrolase n=1 Tax=Myxococcaceae TaxID=31 RepID=UPI00189021D5|nr:alpha/beta hydrolase [Simulacricoccus sp. 17bor-14]